MMGLYCPTLDNDYLKYISKGLFSYNLDCKGRKAPNLCLYLRGGNAELNVLTERRALKETPIIFLAAALNLVFLSSFCNVTAYFKRPPMVSGKHPFQMHQFLSDAHQSNEERSITV